MKKLLFILLTLGLMLPVAHATILTIPPTQGLFSLPLFSIIRNFAMSGGQQQTYFDRCNPCTFHIQLLAERQFYKNVQMNVKAFGGTSHYETACIYTVTFPSYGHFSEFCQAHGYNDYGYDPEHPYWNTCPGHEVRCWRRVSVKPSNVEIYHGDQQVWSMSALHQSTLSENIADILNTECRENIEACYRLYVLGDESGKDKCEKETCSVPFEVRSDVNGGGYAIDTDLHIERYEVGESPFEQIEPPSPELPGPEPVSPAEPPQTQPELPEPTFNLVFWFRSLFESIRGGVCRVIPFLC